MSLKVLGVVWAAASLAVTVMLSASSGFAAGRAGGTLYYERQFPTFATTDPARSPSTGGVIPMVDHAVYDTLLTTVGTKESTPVANLAVSWSSTKNATVYTFKLRKGVRFSDGTPLTSADVVFSFNRMINMSAPYAYLLANVTTTAPNPSTVVLTSTVPNPALPLILTHPYLCVLNSAVIKANGGTDAPDAATTDKANAFFQSQSAGSGPYTVAAFSTTTEIDLVANPYFWGKRPAYSRIVISNVQATQQLLQVQTQSQSPLVAEDLSSRDAQTLKGTSGVKTAAFPSALIPYMQLSKDKVGSPVTANIHIENAIKYGLDYKALVELGGPGAAPTAGLSPPNFVGSLPVGEALTQNLAKARAEVAASGIANPTFTLEYSSDLARAGLPSTTIAQALQAQLAAIGITLTLKGAPNTVTTARLLGGLTQAAIPNYEPAYVDPSNYNVFFPGNTFALRAHWTTNDNRIMNREVANAAKSLHPAARAQAFQVAQRLLMKVGPFIPLVRLPQALAYSSSITSVQWSSVWHVDLRLIGLK